MKFVFYTHSLVSDWNHGNAHFLRGVMRALQASGHEALALEPADGWSRRNLVEASGEAAVAAFHCAFPGLESRTYDACREDHLAALDDADVVVVHEWTEPAVVAAVARAKRQGGRFLLLFHDTHHRAVWDREALASVALDAFDGVLAFGASLAARYEAAGWGRAVFVWHEAADTALFAPRPGIAPDCDLVWVGNWGDGERTAEIDEFLVAPVHRLGLRATVHGVRYPETARRRLARAGIAFGGWVANARVPDVFARHRVTVHIPRRPYATALPGIPTIRMFEALACDIPLVSAPWEDAEALFRPGDYLRAANGAVLERLLRALLADPAMRAEVAASGRETILARHTCAHRVDELLCIVARLKGSTNRMEAAE
jgi:spore maturation protein CgeB